MSPERMTQLDKLLQDALAAGERAIELSAKNAEAIAGLAEFAAATKERLAGLDTESDKDMERGLQCRKEVEGMVSGLAKDLSSLKGRFNYVLGGIAALAGLYGLLVGLFLKHVLG